MKIISKYKEYYDYISKQYGEDEKVVFNRPTIIKFPDSFYKDEKIYNSHLYKIIHSKIINYNWSDIKMINYCRHIISGRNRNEAYKILIFCSKPYLYRYNIFTKEIKYINKNNLIEEGESNGVQRITIDYYRNELERYSNFLETENPFFIKMSKTLRLPYFFIDPQFAKVRNIMYIQTYNEMPNLIDLEFYNLYSADQCWQEIYNFISNNFLSLDPPIELSNEERIVKAGFDKKISFRGK